MGFIDALVSEVLEVGNKAAVVAVIDKTSSIKAKLSQGHRVVSLLAIANGVNKSKGPRVLLVGKSQGFRQGKVSKGGVLREERWSEGNRQWQVQV